MKAIDPRLRHLVDGTVGVLLVLALVGVYGYDRANPPATPSPTREPVTVVEQQPTSLAERRKTTPATPPPTEEPATVVEQRPTLRTKPSKIEPIVDPVSFGRRKNEEFPLKKSRLDLKASDINIAGITYSPELAVSGTVSLVVTNAGKETIEGPIRVTFFEDGDNDSTLDRKDTILAQVEISQSLEPGTKVVAKANVRGRVLFTKNVIWGWVDSSQSYEESNELNNFANSGAACLCTPTAGKFDPVVEWFAEVGNVIMTPAVVDLDGNGVPDVIFVTVDDQTLHAIRGDNGREIWKTTAGIDGSAGIAVGDIDNDGKPEIIAASSSRLVAFEHVGTQKWTSPRISGGIHWGSAAIADLDHDGTPEIIIGGSVLNSDGTLRWQHTDHGGIGTGANGRGPLSIVADVDLDGKPDIVAGKTVYHADGKVMWNAKIPDGFPAIGDFDGDEKPEIVVVANSNVYLLRSNGTKVWGRCRSPEAAGVDRRLWPMSMATGNWKSALRELASTSSLTPTAACSGPATRRIEAPPPPVPRPSTSKGMAVSRLCTGTKPICGFTVVPTAKSSTNCPSRPAQSSSCQ